MIEIVVITGIIWIISGLLDFYSTIYGVKDWKNNWMKHENNPYVIKMGLVKSTIFGSIVITILMIITSAIILFHERIALIMTCTWVLVSLFGIIITLNIIVNNFLKIKKDEENDSPQIEKNGD